MDKEALDWMRKHMLEVDERSKDWPRWMRHQWEEMSREPREESEEPHSHGLGRDPSIGDPF